MGINPTNHEIARIIRIKANKLVGRHGFRRSDVEDIQQDLVLHLLEHGQQLIAHTAAQMTVLDLALDNAIKNIIEKRCAKKRDRRRDIPVENAPISSMVDKHDPIAEFVMRLDIDQLITELPATLIPLAKELHSGTPRADARHVLGFTRGKLRHQIRVIAQHFKALEPETPNSHFQRDSGQ